MSSISGKYDSPSISVIDMVCEGVLCESNETVLENEGVW